MKEIPISREAPVAPCYCCGRVAKEHCYSAAGLRETEISGMCEECWDNMFDEEDE